MNQYAASPVGGGAQRFASPQQMYSPSQPASRPTFTVLTPTNEPISLPSLSKSPMIRDVWADNLAQEFRVLRSYLKDYPFVAMDTEFPGVVAKPVGTFKTTHEFYYQTLRININLLKVIQLGITLLNEKGETPEECCTWQFNFRFSLTEDVYAQDSIDLLRHGGIDFDYFAHYGIEVTHFADLLITSGLVLTSDVQWLAFHAGYDFGYLIKLVTGKELPEREEDFLELFHALFPCVYDLKYLLRSTDISHSLGLDYLAENFKLRRFGTAHQAGSDSLMTGHCYFKLLRECFSGAAPKGCNGVLYGLSEDASSSATPSSTTNVTHNTAGSRTHAYGSPGSFPSGGVNRSFPSTPLTSSAKMYK